MGSARYSDHQRRGLATLTPVTQIEPKSFNQALTLNMLATQALLAAFDPLLKSNQVGGRVLGVTSSVGAEPRAYGAPTVRARRRSTCCSRATGRKRSGFPRPVWRSSIRVGPGPRCARAYPGEDPASVKPPEAVAERIVALLAKNFPPHHRERAD